MHKLVREPAAAGQNMHTGCTLMVEVSPFHAISCVGPACGALLVRERHGRKTTRSCPVRRLCIQLHTSGGEGRWQC